MKNYVLLSALLAVLASPALATEKPKLPMKGPMGSDERFQAVDTNGDGKLSREEYLADAAKRTAEMFDQIDANKDGQATKEEMKSLRQQMMKAVQEQSKQYQQKQQKGVDGAQQ